MVQPPVRNIPLSKVRDCRLTDAYWQLAVWAIEYSFLDRVSPQPITNLTRPNKGNISNILQIDCHFDRLVSQTVPLFPGSKGFSVEDFGLGWTLASSGSCLEIVWLNCGLQTVPDISGPCFIFSFLSGDLGVMVLILSSLWINPWCVALTLSQGWILAPSPNLCLPLVLNFNPLLLPSGVFTP